MVGEEETGTWAEEASSLCRGIRTRTLRKLLSLAHTLCEHRMWKSFDRLKEEQGQDYSAESWDRYLKMAVRSRSEIEYVMEYLGVSERTARDYLTALDRLERVTF